MPSEDPRLQRYRAQAMDLLRTAAMTRNVGLKEEYVRLAHEYEALADEVAEFEPPTLH
ncbi:MAG TPA: hypothetical protein VGB82_04485 [Alphaproteobacteria bacterium]